MSALGLAALIYCLAARLAYVLWVGWALRREERTGHYVRALGPEAGFRRFRRWAAVVMNNDAVALVALCVITRGSWPPGFSTPLRIAAGAALVVIGLGVKLWARASVGPDRYYWSDFFLEPARDTAPIAGPYRVLRNPMYTVGNLHIWGIALGLGSLPGLGAALFAHVAILVFNRVIEQPHVRKLYGGPG
jgi:protein-S-isoprenylcysteine O-methyltransferase Ste14